jgi:hypothetical protein
MAAANRNLEEELDTLKAGLDTLRKDIGSRVSSFGDAATDEVKTRGRRARAAVGRVTERAGDVWDGATNEASRRGRAGVADPGAADRGASSHQRAGGVRHRPGDRQAEQPIDRPVCKAGPARYGSVSGPAAGQRLANSVGAVRRSWPTPMPFRRTSLGGPHRGNAPVHHQPGWWRQAVCKAFVALWPQPLQLFPQVSVGCTGTSRSWSRPHWYVCSRPPAAIRYSCSRSGHSTTRPAAPGPSGSCK